MEVNQGGLGGQVGLGGQGLDEAQVPSASSTSTSAPSGDSASTLHEPPALRGLLYRASDSLMNGLVWLDTHAPDWVRADIKDARSELSNAIEATR